MLARIATRYLCDSFGEVIRGLRRSIQALGEVTMKIASRFLLPLEVFAALMMLSWGIVGGFVSGRIGTILDQHDLDTQWGFVLCGVAIAQFAAAGVESAFGRRWPAQVLLRSVQMRFWAAFAGIATWLWVIYLLLTLKMGSEICVLAIQAPLLLAACVIIAMQNRKVEVLLDPNLPTQDLQRRMREERRSSAEDTY